MPSEIMKDDTQRQLSDDEVKFVNGGELLPPPGYTEPKIPQQNQEQIRRILEQLQEENPIRL